MCKVMWHTFKYIPAWREAEGSNVVRICPEYLENKTHSIRSRQAAAPIPHTHIEASGGFHKKRVNGSWQDNSAQHTDKCVYYSRSMQVHLDDVSTYCLFLFILSQNSDVLTWPLKPTFLRFSCGQKTHPVKKSFLLHEEYYVNEHRYITQITVICLFAI